MSTSDGGAPHDLAVATSDLAINGDLTGVPGDLLVVTDAIAGDLLSSADLLPTGPDLAGTETRKIAFSVRQVTDDRALGLVQAGAVSGDAVILYELRGSTFVDRGYVPLVADDAFATGAKTVEVTEVATNATLYAQLDAQQGAVWVVSKRKNPHAQQAHLGDLSRTTLVGGGSTISGSGTNSLTGSGVSHQVYRVVAPTNGYTSTTVSSAAFSNATFYLFGKAILDSDRAFLVEYISSGGFGLLDRIVSLPSFASTSGGAVSLSGLDFVQPTQATSLIGWKVEEFESATVRAQIGPSTLVPSTSTLRELLVERSPAGDLFGSLGNKYNPTYSLAAVWAQQQFPPMLAAAGDSATSVDLTATYRLAFDSTWPVVVRATHLFTWGTSSATLSATRPATDFTSSGSFNALRPLTGPVLDPKVNGIDLIPSNGSDIATAISQPPTFSWTAPTLDKSSDASATSRYEVECRNQTGNRNSFLTTDTTLLVPSGVFGSGEKIGCTIRAYYVAGAVDADLVLGRGLRHGYAEVATVAFTME